MKAKVFNYNIVKTLPLSKLEDYKNHKRMRVFYNKGVECVNPKCNVVGTQLAIGVDNGGHEHIDVYTDDFYPLTVDHRQPRSKGGTDDLENLDPMCAGCNTNKGNELDWDGVTKSKILQELENGWLRGNFEIADNLQIGTLIYKAGKKKKKFKEWGIVSKVITNPHTKQLNFMLEGNDKSMYYINRAYIKL